MLSLRYSGQSDKDGSGKKTSSTGSRKASGNGRPDDAASTGAPREQARSASRSRADAPESADHRTRAGAPADGIGRDRASSVLPIVSPVGHELILGGQRSGKSRRAEQLAEQWLKGAVGRKAAFVATAQARDDEMRHRIERHQEQRRARLPGMRTIEEPLALDRVIRRYSRPERLLVIDCLTLWLANQLARHEDVVPRKGHGAAENLYQSEAMTSLLTAIEQSRGPLVFVSNEIGLGVVPVGAGVRAYVDALGWLNQQVAARCQRACLMVAGQPLWLKREAQPAAEPTSMQERPYEAIPTLVETLLGSSSAASHPVLPDVAAALSGMPESMIGADGQPPATFGNDPAAGQGRRPDGEGTDETGPGTVWFVGAGPGDPDLLTVKGRDLIAQAGAILFAGSLVSEAATRWAPPGCEIADSKGMTLEEICHWLASRALRHRTVIRLQTGDPSLYGALIEMVQPLDDAGVPVKVVPGVSSAFAAAAAGVESLTLPEVTQTVILTRVAGRTPMPEGEDLVSLARHRSTLCIFLSITLLSSIQRDLRAAGWPEDAPILVVHKASWPGEEKIVRSTLADVKEACRQAKIVSQAMIIASPTIGARQWSSLTKSRLYDASFTHRFRRASEERLVDMAVSKLNPHSETQVPEGQTKTTFTDEASDDNLQ